MALAVERPDTPPVPGTMHTDLRQYSVRRSKTGAYADNLDVDVLIVGAGFGQWFRSSFHLAFC